MKRNISIYIFAAAFAVSVPSMAVAQNLDPTVEVNKTYEGKLIEVHKPSIEMAVPDSVLRFDLDFDYSVFENPYKGAYEFKPYVTDMQPVEGASARKSLYLKAGAGLRPVTLSPMPYLDMVWAPVMNNAFKMNVYAGHESFFGRYMKMPGYDPAAPADVLRLNGEASRENYDMQTKAGVDARYDWDEGVAKVDLGYFGLAERYEERNDMFNSLNVSAYAASKDWGQLFNYEAGASYSFGGDRLEYMDADSYRLAEHDLKVSGRLKASLMENHMMSFEMGVDNVSYSGNYDCGVSRLVFAPSYHFTLDRLDVDAGFSIEALVPGSKSDMFATKGQYIYPDVTVSYQLIQDAMRVYAHIGGGTEVNTFSSLLKDNHHLDMFSGAGTPLMDNTVESRKKKNALKDRYLNYIIYLCKSDSTYLTLIHQRNDDDIWKHLWEFPIVESMDSLLDIQTIEKRLLSTSFISEHHILAQRDFKHILSHQRLHARFIIQSVSSLPSIEDCKTISIDELSNYPLSRLNEKAIEFLYTFL